MSVLCRFCCLFSKLLNYPRPKYSVLYTAFVNKEIMFSCLESQTIEDFGHKMALHRADVEHLRSVFMAVENGDIGMLKSLGIRVSLIWYIS